MKPGEKTALARSLFAAGDLKGALRHAKGFRLGLTKEDRDALVRGYECLLHPDFYRALGKDPEAEVDRARMVFAGKIMRMGEGRKENTSAVAEVRSN